MQVSWVCEDKILCCCHVSFDGTENMKIDKISTRKSICKWHNRTTLIEVLKGDLEEEEADIDSEHTKIKN